MLAGHERFGLCVLLLLSLGRDDREDADQVGLRVLLEEPASSTNTPMNWNMEAR